ncbi:MAG: hypothetical protein U0904_03975 [Candidatus Nanopelagicales bacterium]|nr:hypothetical protein [Candidatus Nanopelagicales bacterium]
MHTQVRTLNSVYELDLDSRRIRRMASDHEPTPHQSDTPDGAWKDCLDVAICDDGLMIVWRVDHEDGLAITRRTFTSPIMSIDGPAPPFQGGLN